jgi:hypothetical protein
VEPRNEEEEEEEEEFIVMLHSGDVWDNFHV